MPDHADAYWVGYSMGTLALFLALELWALKARVDDKPSGTLTAVLRRWLGVSPRRWWAPLGVALFVGVLVTFGSHIVIGVP